jgi:peptidoglycan/LPS O-acetylase OafA/YrhL
MYVTSRRALAAGLAFVAFGAFTVMMSYPVDCRETAWVVYALGVVAALLTGGAILALVWRQQDRSWIAAATTPLVWIALLILSFLRAGGACLE